MKFIFTYAFIIVISLATGLAHKVYPQDINKNIDEMIRKQYLPDGPGTAVLAAKEGEVIYRKAFGMANLELGVPMQPEMVFEIGSMTKQFTAVSILMLMEQGKLSLDDEITKYIPDYPVQGQKITIHHLLTHTSGIKSYTSMEEWAPLWRKDMEPLELIDVFKNQPMDFAPGEKFLYNNSAYFILGYIIEKASGMTYESFIETNIFKPLQMNDTYYGSQSRIIRNRAAGYQKGENGFNNAEYLSLTQPYSAGSIMSNIDDLLKWMTAIEENKLVKKESIDKAFTNYTLNNGTPIHYGYGWFLNEIKGSPTIEHGGGIFGYTTNGIWLPEENVYVVMLTNRDDVGPDEISAKIAALVIGKPYSENKPALTVKETTLKELAGVYEFEDGSFRSIILEDGKLYSQREGSVRFLLVPETEYKYNYEGTLSSIEFLPGADGAMDAIFSRRVEQSKGHKTDKALPSMEEITLDPKQMEPYIGIYEIQPGFSIKIMLEDGHLFGQATGQDRFEMFPESPSRFFLKVVDAQIEFFNNNSGAVDSLILYQAGQEIKGVKK
jgi:CubicO group peptidase (beta-lactamase class C family)